MKFINTRIHGVLDYATVIIFALAPALLGLSGFPALLCYALAVIHLLMTAITAFPLGLARMLPMKLHAVVELLVAVLLIIVSHLSAAFDGPARPFFTVMGVVIFLVWLFSRVD